MIYLGLNHPPAVQVFLSAVMSRNDAALQGCLAADAHLVDEGRSYRGGEVAGWLASLSADRIGSSRALHCARRNGQSVVSILTDEADAGGSVAETLREWCFRTQAARIVSVQIERRELPALPSPIGAYVSAMNRFDLDAMVAIFSEDALVNDQLRDHWGKPAIREWAERDIIAHRTTMYVVGCVQHYDGIIVTAHINGDFDRRGLPDPLVLSFHFATAGSRIVQLIILQNQGGE